MRPSFRIGMALLLWAAVIGSPGVSSAARNAGDQAGGLLSAEQGEMLVDFALQAGAHLHSKPDCSHLVHTLYSQAGLVYSYQPSRALYLGVERFVRVRNPQPGDLIVWRGHVGIVVSPDDKTFFSSVRSGIITESWTADHWRARGRPRFFRYRLGPDSNPALLASLAHEDAMGTHTISVTQEADEDSDDARDSNSSGKASARSEQGSTQPARNASLAAQDASSDSDSSDAAASTVAVIQHKKPGKQDIVTAFLQASDAAARKLSAGNTPALTTVDRPVSVFTGAEVARLKIRHDSGVVTLKITETILLEEERVLPAKTTERELTIHRRSANGSAEWIITDAHQRLYIPQAQALAAFQHQAELLLHRSPNSPAARAVVKALDLLYDQPPAAAQRASLK